MFIGDQLFYTLWESQDNILNQEEFIEGNYI